MKQLYIFTDGSVNTKTKVGYGACLMLTEQDIEADIEPIRLLSLSKHVETKRFEPTSSTKLELQCLLWALNRINDSQYKITVYTDSQNIVGLAGRRERLEKNDFYSGKGKRLNNYELYQEYYQLTDRLDCEIIKVRGHLVSKEKNAIDRLFTLVDKASRRALRKG